MKRLVVKVFVWMMGDYTTAGSLKRRMGQVFLKSFPGQITCTEFEQFVIDFYEKTLSDKQHSMFEFHMSICPKCNVHFRSYVLAIELGKKVCEGEGDDLVEDVPEDLVRAILATRAGSQ